MTSRAQRRQQALADIRETNDVLSSVRDTSTMSDRDRRIYEDGLELTRQKRAAANETLGEN